MRSLAEIRILLNALESKTADELENQDMDFKELKNLSLKGIQELVIEAAVCMANGGGGTIVFGVNDKEIGRMRAIAGIPPELEINRLRKAVYDSTDPKITPVFEELSVPEGTGRILVMQIYPGFPPYTDTSGKGKVRIGKDCQPLTGTLRRRIMIETGETDPTATEIAGKPNSYLSASAMEQLREAARRDKAPAELLQMSDLDLLNTLGVIRNGKLTLAGLLLAGRDEAIREHLPGYGWTHLRMRDDTQYTDRMDGREAIPFAIARLLDRIMADNPITTVEYGPFHFEYRTYPEIALREALMNAFCHEDFRISSPILVKQYPNKLEIGNPGGFIGGISPENILHHQPVARNPLLVDALTRLRLVNRSNLGVSRMFQAMLIEGKEPPIIQEQGDSVKVVFHGKILSIPFRSFVAEESKHGRRLLVDHLLIMQYLLHHPELDTASASRVCQRSEPEAREILNEMEVEMEYLERGGTGRGTYWMLRPDLHRRLIADGHPERDRRIDWEAAKTRVLSVLKQRSERNEAGFSNSEIRQITHLNRHQVLRLMRELIEENPRVELVGQGRFARYRFNEDI
jgi:ATP-dependent DNA helicase RecG